MGDICLFVSTERWDPVSAIIRLGTEDDWSHTGFYRPADGFTFSAMDDGKGVSFRKPIEHAKLLLLTTPRVDDMFEAALTQEGKPYNSLGILGIIFHRNWSDPNAEFCSQLVLWSAIKIGAPLLNPQFIPIQHMTPRDILLSPLVSELSA
jgi:hypothetical protein